VKKDPESTIKAREEEGENEKEEDTKDEGGEEEEEEEEVLDLKLQIVSTTKRSSIMAKNLLKCHISSQLNLQFF